jgi:arginyl-tRNA synthetase
MDRISESPRVYWATEGYYAGAFVIQIGEEKVGQQAKAEVLIRKNGLPTYVGKDIAYHMWKLHLVPNRLGYQEYATQPNGEVLWSTDLHGDHREEEPPEALINIIAVDQTLAQSTVKEGLRVAGFPNEADELVHLAYGLVMSPEGKLAGRKGNAMAADDVIDQAVAVAYDRVREKRSQDLTDAEMRSIAEAVGIGAVRYFMVQYNPLREIIFNVNDVVSYDGNTGLYIQYALVRMFAILRRAREDRGIQAEEIASADLTLLVHEQEKRLVYHISLYPGVIADAARTLTVNLVAEFAFDLATIFSQFYRDCSVLDAEPPLRAARLRLVETVRDALAGACEVLGVPVIERL